MLDRMGDNGRESSDKTTVEVAKSEEGLDVGKASRRLLVLNSLNLRRMYTNAILANNKAKGLGLRLNEVVLQFESALSQPIR